MNHVQNQEGRASQTKGLSFHSSNHLPFSSNWAKIAKLPKTSEPEYKSVLSTKFKLKFTWIRSCFKGEDIECRGWRVTFQGPQAPPLQTHHYDIRILEAAHKNCCFLILPPRPGY